MTRDKVMADALDYKTCGIVELAVRNPNVTSYMKHWESRAMKAEARLLALETRLETLLTTLGAEQFPGKRILPEKEVEV